MEVMRLQDAKPYEAPKHFDMRSLGCRASTPAAPRTSGSVCRTSCPAAAPRWTPRRSRRSTSSLEGEVTVITDDGETTLGPLDSCRLAPGEARSIVNRDQPAGLDAGRHALPGRCAMSVESAGRRSPALFDLSGRSALITGATGALGSAVGARAGDGGVKVTLAGGGADALEELGSRAAGGGARGRARRAAARQSTEDADAMVARGGRRARPARLPVHRGRREPPGQDRGRQVPSDWQAVMDANVRGTWLACRSAGRQMIEQGDGGRVVLVSSTRGKLGLAAGYSAYCTSKAAIDGLTQHAGLRVGTARDHRQRRSRRPCSARR